jgi:hypothetical protein
VSSSDTLKKRPQTVRPRALFVVLTRRWII